MYRWPSNNVDKTVKDYHIGLNKNLCPSKRTKFALTLLTMTVAGFLIGFCLSWSKSKNKILCHAFFWRIYTLAQRPGTNCNICYYHVLFLLHAKKLTNQFSFFSWCKYFKMNLYCIYFYWNNNKIVRKSLVFLF